MTKGVGRRKSPTRMGGSRHGGVSANCHAGISLWLLYDGLRNGMRRIPPHRVAAFRPVQKEQSLLLDFHFISTPIRSRLTSAWEPVLGYSGKLVNSASDPECGYRVMNPSNTSVALVDHADDPGTCPQVQIKLSNKLAQTMHFRPAKLSDSCQWDMER